MKKIRRPFITILLPVIALSLLAYALASVLNRPQPVATESTLSPPASPYDHRVAGIGIVEPESESISIGTHLSGIVTEVAVKVGDKVRQGDRLFAIDDRDAKAQLQLAETQLESAKVQAADARHQLSLYESVTDKRAISDNDMSQRKFAVELADRKIAEAEAEIEVMTTQLERLNVRAPIDGEILRINVRPGEYAQAGALSTPLMIMGNTEIMHVRVEIDETDALRIDPAAKATGTLRGYTEKPVQLTFVRKEPFIKPKRSLTGDGNERIDTRTQEILYSFDNHALAAFVGQQMDVFIEASALGQKE